nr:MAG TPA: hypothetical protein [Caudoviricetes sp.]
MKFDFIISSTFQNVKIFLVVLRKNLYFSNCKVYHTIERRDMQ